MSTSDVKQCPRLQKLFLEMAFPNHPNSMCVVLSAHKIISTVQCTSTVFIQNYKLNAKTLRLSFYKLRFLNFALKVVRVYCCNSRLKSINQSINQHGHKKHPQYKVLLIQTLLHRNFWDLSAETQMEHSALEANHVMNEYKFYIMFLH